MKIEKTTKVVIPLDELTKMLQEKKILWKRQSISHIEIEDETKNITVTCIENLNYNFKTGLLQDPKVENSKEICDILEKPIQELDISVGLINILRSKGFEKLKDVITLTEKEYYETRGFGKGMLTQLEKALSYFGLKLKEPS